MAKLNDLSVDSNRLIRLPIVFPDTILTVHTSSYIQVSTRCNTVEGWRSTPARSQLEYATIVFHLRTQQFTLPRAENKVQGYEQSIAQNDRNIHTDERFVAWAEALVAPVKQIFEVNIQHLHGDKSFFAVRGTLFAGDNRLFAACNQQLYSGETLFAAVKRIFEANSPHLH